MPRLISHLFPIPLMYGEKLLDLTLDSLGSLMYRAVHSLMITCLRSRCHHCYYYMCSHKASVTWNLVYMCHYASLTLCRFVWYIRSCDASLDS